MVLVTTVMVRCEGVSSRVGGVMGVTMEDGSGMGVSDSVGL
jgi:hypothetical protein